MNNQQIAIIGGGNLGSSIAIGLVNSKIYKPEKITVTRRKIENIKYLKEQGFNITSDNIKAISGAKVIILCIKPYQIKGVLISICSKLDAKKHLIISVVTGIKLDDMQKIIGTAIPLFRAMPNTAIEIRQSMTCLATNNGTQEEKDNITRIFNQLGKCLIIEENLMEASTVLGACGIAYAMRFIRAASQGGIEIGFDANTAQTIATQTVKGATELIIKNNLHPEHEIDRVTTPQGCTIVGLNEMEHQGFSSSLIKGILSSYKKIQNINIHNEITK